MSHDEEVEMALARMLGDRPDELSELVLGIRRAIVELAPGCSELLYHTYAVSNVFTFTGKLGQAFIHIAAYAAHVNLGFNFGARLDDPESLLDGTGKLIRHIRIDDLRTLQVAGVRSLMHQAIEAGKRLAEERGGMVARSFVDKSGP